MRIQINNLNDLAININTQDRATEVNLKVIQNGYDLKRFKGVWNITQDKLANVVSNKYYIIQHSDVLQAVTETLGRLGIQVKGKLETFNHTMRANLIFTDKNKVEVKDDSNGGIMLGFRVLNSYDKTTSFRLEMIGYRLVCSNGMVLGKALNDIRSITYHTGKEKTLTEIQMITESFIRNMINSSAKLQTYINDAMIDTVEYVLAKKIIAKLIRTKKHTRFINRLLKLGRLTRWDMYNALTEYATHGHHLKPNVENCLQSKAQKVLTTKIEVMINDLEKD